MKLCNRHVLPVKLCDRDVLPVMDVVRSAGADSGVAQTSAAASDEVLRTWRCVPRYSTAEMVLARRLALASKPCPAEAHAGV